MSTPKLLGAAAVLLSMIGIGCGQKPAVNDKSLITDIQSKLYADNTTRQANVNVAAKDGVVTLSGDVPSSDVELQAMKIANGTAGVRSVDDQMKVNGASAAANEPPASGPGATPGNSLTGSSPSGSAAKPRSDRFFLRSRREPRPYHSIAGRCRIEPSRNRFRNSTQIKAS